MTLEDHQPKFAEPIQVGDIVIFGTIRLRVVGVYLGGTGVLNTIGLRSYCGTRFCNVKDDAEMIVPEHLVRLTGVFRHVANT